MVKVLVVDDKPSQVELLCAMLTTIGVECFAAYSGVEAVNTAKQVQPQLIIMDWLMPAETLTGDAATRQILADHSTHHIPVIACSAISNLEDIAYQAGCVDCVSKPFSLDTFINKIRQYLD